LSQAFFQHAQDVFAVGSGIHHIVIAHLGVVHGKTIVVLGGNGDVAHPCLFHHGYPFIRIELGGIEKSGQLFVLHDGNVLSFHDPFGDALVASPCHDGVYTPVHKKSVFVILEPFPVVQVFLGGHIAFLGLQPERGKHRKNQNQGNKSWVFHVVWFMVFIVNY
jgi:hypothetical protein